MLTARLPGCSTPTCDAAADTYEFIFATLEDRRAIHSSASDSSCNASADSSTVGAVVTSRVRAMYLPHVRFRAGIYTAGGLVSTASPVCVCMGEGSRFLFTTVAFFVYIGSQPPAPTVACNIVGCVRK